MLIKVHLQKNNTVIITAPDGSVYPHRLNLDATKEDKAKMFEAMGLDLMMILNDPDQPKAEIVVDPSMAHTPQAATNKATEDNPPEAKQGVEGALRGFMESLMPGSSVILNKLQDISSDSE